MKIEIEKPVVPQWFDDWYRTFKGDKAHALYHLNRIGWGYGLTDYNDKEVKNYPNRLFNVVEAYDNYGSVKEYLSKAILFGYEVELEPLYYAKIKGWELTEGESVFWKSCIITENPMLPRLYTGSKEEDGFARTKMTIQYWNKVGINETNADFEEVE